MEILTNDSIHIHQEFVRREASLRLALKQSGLIDPSIVARILPAVGETLIRIGTRLKEHSFRKLTPEEASTPTFLIML